MSAQVEGDDNVLKEVELDNKKQGEKEHYLEHNREEDEKGFIKGIMGNPRSMLKDVKTLKQKMQVISKDFE